jgi:hypothetical protein
MTSHGDEALTVLEWAYYRLTHDLILAGLLSTDLAGMAQRVWEAPAPEGTPTPFITIQLGTPMVTSAFLGPGPSTLVTLPVQVKVVDQRESYDAIRPVAKRLADLLTGSFNWQASSGGLVLTSTRTEVIAYPESGDGMEYRHLGAVWTVQAQ